MQTNIKPIPWETDADENERFALEECVKRQRLDHRVSVMIVPGDRIDLATRFASLGAEVSLLDQAEQQKVVEGRILASGQAAQLRFVAGSLDTLPSTLEGEPFDIIFIRRGLAPLPYKQAKQSLRSLMQHLRIGGKLYLTLLGLHSELGDNYPDADKPVGERHACLAPAMAEKYRVKDAVCLYSERDLFMLLLESGASVLRTSTTTYGNIKGIAVRV